MPVIEPKTYDIPILRGLPANPLEHETDYPNLQMRALFVNTKVQGIQEIDGDEEPLKLHFRPGGGTDFRPGFEWIDRESDSEPACVIYFTDGACWQFPEDPGYPVLWALTSSRYKSNFTNRFGEAIIIND